MDVHERGLGSVGKTRDESLQGALVPYSVPCEPAVLSSQLLPSLVGEEHELQSLTIKSNLSFIRYCVGLCFPKMAATLPLTPGLFSQCDCHFY